MNNRIVEPELRFSEFKNNKEWVVYTLESLSDSIFDGVHQTPQYATKGIPFYSVENIVSGVKNKFITEEDYKIYTQKNKPEKYDILITRIGTIGYSKVIDWDFQFSIYVTLAVIKSNKKFNSYYLNAFFQSSWYQKEILSKSLLNAIPCKINMNELKKTRVILPPNGLNDQLEEQQKIAECLNSIDELIAGEEDKLKELKNHKKGLLQKLFPKNNSSNPELRFPEFKEDWVIDKLSDEKLLIYENGKAHENDIVEKGKYIVVNSKFISSDGKVKKYTDAPNMLAQKNDILMVLSDVPSGQALAKCYLAEQDNLYTVNQRVCKLTPRKINSIFLYYILNRNPYFLSFDDGIKQTNLKKEEVLNFAMLHPKSDEEQQKIAECISSIDDLISAQTEKIEALKLHKKGLMQGLFPSLEEVKDEQQC